jgi:hypothetical protein
MKKIIGTRNDTIEKTLKFLTILFSKTKKDFVPQKEAFSVNKGFNVALMKDEIINLNKYCDRDSYLSNKLLIRYGIIEQKKINGVNYVRWNTSEPSEAMARQLCDDNNLLKNHKNDFEEDGVTDAEVIQVLEVTETPVNIHEVELTTNEDTQSFKTLEEFIVAQRAESNKLREYAKTLAEETIKLSNTVRELTTVLASFNKK